MVHVLYLLTYNCTDIPRSIISYPLTKYTRVPQGSYFCSRASNCVTLGDSRCSFQTYMVEHITGIGSKAAIL